MLLLLLSSCLTHGPVHLLDDRVHGPPQICKHKRDEDAQERCQEEEGPRGDASHAAHQQVLSSVWACQMVAPLLQAPHQTCSHLLGTLSFIRATTVGLVRCLGLPDGRAPSACSSADMQPPAWHIVFHQNECSRSW